MRKIIAIVLAVVMIAAMSVIASAKTIDMTTPSGQGTTNVTYNSSESFVVTIPEDIGLEVDDDGVGTANDKVVSLDSMKLSANKTLTVTVAGKYESTVENYNWMLKDEGTNGVIGYTITKSAAANEAGTAIAHGAILIQQASIKNFTGVTTYLDFATEETTQAGSFADVLTFTAAVTINGAGA